MTEPQAPMRATRVRKARAESACGLCGVTVRTGQQIGLAEGRWWAHIACIIGRSARTAASPHTGNQEGSC